MNITIYGAASPKIDQSYIYQVEELGRFLAKNDHKLIYGGGARGLMGAIARGFKSENGYIIGISPTLFENIDGELYDQCDEFIFTKTMSERKQLLEQYADAFIVTPGGIGTFEEMFEILSLKQLNIINKPVVIYNVNNYFDSLAAMLNESMDKKFIHADNDDLYFISNDHTDIINYINNYNHISKDYRK